MQSGLTSDQESSNNYETIINTTLALMYVITPEGRIVRFNRACEITTGFVFDEVKDRLYWELFLVTDDAAAAEAAFKSANIGYFLNQREGRWLSKVSGWRFIEWSNAAVVDAEGVVQLLVGTGIDITEKKEVQLRSVDLEIQYAKAHELIKFFRGISHDIRTPLATLMTSLYLISRQNQQPQLKPQLDTMQAEAKYLTQLINDTQFAFDLMDSNQLHLKSMSLNLMLQHLIMDFNEDITANKLQINLHLQGDLPAISGDNSLLYRAVQNVIDNAIRYTPQNGTVTLRTMQHNTNVIVEVSDTGIGISPEDLPHIFDYFYKADKARTFKGAGSGLGLTITKQVIQLHYGRVEVESELDHGSTFRLIVPVMGR